MTWGQVILGEVCSKIGSGATPKGGATVYIDEGTSLIRSQNVYNLSFSYDGLAHINEEAARKLNGVNVEEQDILLNITGDSVARTCLVPLDVLPARVNQHVAIVRPNHKVLNPIFLSYYLASPHMQALMLGLAVGKGASRNAMTKDMISAFKVPCPPMKIQTIIVDKLKAFDDLIVNNQRQIELLEEAAQRLYKEWFVDLHFPGYEDVQIVDGIPEGWKRIPLGKTLRVVRGRSYSSKELSENEGSLMINLSNVRPYGGYNRNREKHYTGKVNEDQFVETHDLIMGVTDMTQERRTVGRVAIVPNLHTQAMISMDLIKLVPVEGSPLFYYGLLNYGGYSEVISRFANGTNVLHLRPDVLDVVDAVIPDICLQNRFVEFLENIQNRLDALQDEMIIAAEARDRLLPKLMSGEIEV